jgi:hypothetical protein
MCRWTTTERSGEDDGTSRQAVGLERGQLMADQARVFVSHHHRPEGDVFTARLVADLETAGADVWVDTKGITSCAWWLLLSTVSAWQVRRYPVRGVRT